MKIPLEYGDNFPVPLGSWNPAVPWRFPKAETLHNRPRLLTLLLPWVTLGVGVTLGVLWMSWRSEPTANRPAETAAVSMGKQQVSPLPSAGPAQRTPRSKPMRGAKSNWA